MHTQIKTEPQKHTESQRNTQAHTGTHRHTQAHTDIHRKTDTHFDIKKTKKECYTGIERAQTKGLESKVKHDIDRNISVRN